MMGSIREDSGPARLSDLASKLRLAQPAVNGSLADSRRLGAIHDGFAARQGGDQQDFGILILTLTLVDVGAGSLRIILAFLRSAVFECAQAILEVHFGSQF